MGRNDGMFVQSPNCFRIRLHEHTNDISKHNH